MDDKSARELVESIVEKGRIGLHLEREKVELKRQWIDLAKDKGSGLRARESEFLKDLVAMANTPGLEGYLIYGIDEHGNVYDAPFTQTGFPDQSLLRQFVIRKVSKPVDFNIVEVPFQDKKVAILVVPPSLEKPHSINLYVTRKGIQRENYIPIRRGTAVTPANAFDIEWMIFDRKNIIPEYDLRIDTYPHQPRLTGSHLAGEVGIVLEFQVALENAGRRPILLVAGEFFFHPDYGIEPNPIRLQRYWDRARSDSETVLESAFLSIPANEVRAYWLRFSCKVFGGGNIIKSRIFLAGTVQLRGLNGKCWISSPLVIQREDLSSPWSVRQATKEEAKEYENDPTV